MGARDKINAISLNFNINKRKMVHTRGYKLPINAQNSMQKDSAQAKISLKVVGGYFFDSPRRVALRSVKCHPKFNRVQGVLSCGAFVVLPMFNSASASAADQDGVVCDSLVAADRFRCKLFDVGSIRHNETTDRNARLPIYN